MVDTRNTKYDTNDNESQNTPPLEPEPESGDDFNYDVGQTTSRIPESGYRYHKETDPSKLMSHVNALRNQLKEKNRLLAEQAKIPVPPNDCNDTIDDIAERAMRALQKTFPPNWRPITLKENTLLLKERLLFIAGYAEEDIEVFLSLMITVLSDEATMEVQRRVPTRDESVNTVDKVIDLLLSLYGPPVIDAVQQLMKPTAKPGEMMTSFLERLTLLTSQHTHPSPEYSTRGLRSLLITQPAYSSLISIGEWGALLKRATAITAGLKEAGILVSANFIQQLSTPTPQPSATSKPSNTTLCAHCGKRGHDVSNC